MTRKMTGAKMIVQALIDQGVDTVFGYPGGAVLPIYDEIFQQNHIKHVLVRHEQGAVHAAEGYARSTGKPGVCLVTSGPGATNAVTGLTDALMDSIPIIVLTGQVPTFMIGSDAFQEADTVGITRPCTKHNWLVKETDKLSGVIHEAFHVATSGRPGPVLVDIPKDVQFATGAYTTKAARKSHYQPQLKGDMEAITELVEAIEKAKRPVFYTGGGVINSGPAASPIAARTGGGNGLPHHLDAHGARLLSRVGRQMAGYAGHARALRGQHGDARLRSDDQHRRAVRRPHHRRGGEVQPQLEESAYRHRPQLDQQGHPRGHPHHGRRGPCARGSAEGLEVARAQDKLRGDCQMVAADRGMARCELPQVRAERPCYQTTIRDGAAGGADQEA